MTQAGRAERAGQVRHRGVDRDRKIAQRQRRGGLRHIAERLAHMRHIAMRREPRRVALAQIALQAHERHAADREQRLQ